MSRGAQNSRVERYQNRAFEILQGIFGENNVEKEWDAAKNSQDDLTRDMYCPRLDIAIGTLNTRRQMYEDNLRISRMINDNTNLLKKLWRVSELRGFSFEDFMRKLNKNPRCAVAIEIENSGSSKHMLGNVANVSILGKIGIVIPFNDKKLALCKRIKKFVIFAAEVKKIDDIFRNVLIIKKDKFLRVINGSA